MFGENFRFPGSSSETTAPEAGEPSGASESLSITNPETFPGSAVISFPLFVEVTMPHSTAVVSLLYNLDPDEKKHFSSDGTTISTTVSYNSLLDYQNQIKKMRDLILSSFTKGLHLQHQAAKDVSDSDLAKLLGTITISDASTETPFKEAA